jgi:hypothetical protein
MESETFVEIIDLFEAHYYDAYKINSKNIKNIIMDDFIDYIIRDYNHELTEGEINKMLIVLSL